MEKRYQFVLKGMGPDLEWKEIARSQTIPSNELNEVKEDVEKIREELIGRTFNGEVEATLSFGEKQLQIKPFWGLEITIEEA